jgi:single-stranded-DNA-specific exonuclease
MQQQAFAAIDALHIGNGNDLPVGLCLFDKGWHQGVIGILAGRIKERLHRPVIAFAPQDENELKGSARSVPGLHIRDALDAVAARHPGLLTKFGGHAMAAGLSLPRAHFDDFRAAFDSEARRHLAPDQLQGVIHSDGQLEDAELNLEIAELLRNAGPWGQGFPEPVFHGRFRVQSRRVVGERHLKLVLAAAGGTRPIDAIAFNTALADCPEPAREVLIAYRLDVNEYRGLLSPQLVVEHLEAVG